VCVCACMRACVRVYVCVYVHMFVRIYVSTYLSTCCLSVHTIVSKIFKSKRSQNFRMTELCGLFPVVWNMGVANF